MTEPAARGAIRPTFDGKLNLAVGKSRKDVRWKNVEMSWADLVSKLSRTTRTRETVAEYQTMSKTQQGDLKDVGGFVGGVLSGGRRKADAVSWRSMLTLDLDFAPQGFWSTFETLNDYAAALYSTHSHTSEKPRLRLVIPTSRRMSNEEYGAVSRRVADDLGIDYFDDTTFEPSRLFYWPSTSEDGEFLFKWQDGPFLDVDEALKTYADWRDPSQWPESSRAVKQRQRLADRQGDPLTKPGLIGAFCRAHSVTEAIETYLEDVYSPTDSPNRWTYAAGSTAGGLVVYDDDTFAFSHHGTDPIGGQLLNAFDLVRIHRFGELDQDTPDGHPHNRLPSYLAMQEFVRKDDASMIELAKDKLDTVREDFAEADDSWMAKLEWTKGSQRLEGTMENAALILQNDPRLAGKIRYNEFAARGEIIGDIPWDRMDGRWSDDDASELKHLLEREDKYDSPIKLREITSTVAKKNRFHPVRDYFNSLNWDGELRLDTLIEDYLGVSNPNVFTQLATRKTFVAAVKRVYEPGCKFDYVLTLQGPQGVGKTSLLRKLAGDWLQETMLSMEGKEASEQIRGYLIVELGELNAIRKSAQEAVKSFITRQVDVYRVPFDRNTSEFPRQSIFIATTNETSFISDLTGGRRFWPIEITGSPGLEPWQNLTQDTVDQIWAEAVFRYREGETVYFTDPEHKKLELEAQSRSQKDNEKMGLIAEYLDIPLPESWQNLSLSERRMYLESHEDHQGEPRDRVCVAEIWEECLGGDVARMRRFEADELHALMANMEGWKRYKRSGGKMKTKHYGVQRTYVREDEKYG